MKEEKPPRGRLSSLAGDAAPALRVVDSITQLGASDAGCLAVSGSHGGLSSARYAMVARPLLSVFNDAGVGRDAAGVAGLFALQSEGLAACAVAHASARIGEGRSTLEDGVISHANVLARQLGVQPGQSCRDALEAVRKRKHSSVAPYGPP